jgi:hypothetical protein
VLNGNFTVLPISSFLKFLLSFLKDKLLRTCFIHLKLMNFCMNMLVSCRAQLCTLTYPCCSQSHDIWPSLLVTSIRHVQVPPILPLLHLVQYCIHFLMNLKF